MAALVTVAGIWGVAVGVSRIVIAFELRRLPHDVDQAYAQTNNGTSFRPGPERESPAPAAF